MDTQTALVIIGALAGAVSTLAGMLYQRERTENRELKDALKEANAATAAANEVNARLAQLWIDQHSDQMPSSSRSGRR